MRKSLWAVAALAVAMLAAPAVHQSAQALPAAKAAAGESGVVQVGARWRRGHHRWRRGFRGHRGPVFRFGFRSGGNCAWLRHKARRSGSAYWWRRYRNCRH